MRKSFGIFLYSERDLENGFLTHLHVHDANGNHELKELAVSIDAPLTMSIPLKIKELLEKTEKVKVSIHNQSRRSYDRGDRDRTEEWSTLVFTQDMATLAVQLARIERNIAEVRHGRVVSIDFDWEE